MSENSILKAMLAQYESATTSSSDNTFDEKNYYTTYLKDGIDSRMSRIRILPVNGSPFQEVHVHSAKVDGKNRKFVCLQHLNDEPCPFCDTREKLLASGEKTDEDLAKEYRARKMYIVKVIDRENESDGPKFWRFPVNYKKEGIHDKIMAIVKMLGEDITDVENGRDLILNIVRIKNPRGGSYPSVNSIQAFGNGPLSTDAALSKGWSEDAKTWKDVYTVKNYDYLKIVVLGKTPIWDKKLEKYVAKEDTIETETEDTSAELDSQISFGANAPKTSNVETTNIIEDDDSSYEDDDENYDLPF